MFKPLSLKSWDSTGGSSYHFPIILKIEPHGKKPPAPLKLNESWIKEEDYRILIKYTCIPLKEEGGNTLMHQFACNLSRVNVVTKKWARTFNGKYQA
jgi:hypothetical protein